jgi:hypothetical protein
MNKIERIQMVKAMEFLARQINDEDIFEKWLTCGVVDGDIDYSEIVINPNDEEILDCYLGDEDFADLMDTFLHIMALAAKVGGLYCDGIVSRNAYAPVEPVPFA